ncbi:MAG: HAD family hydrolase [Methanophagales archaeon ANME-1-THS]|nr:MAG: HAD family hydrolase [Methanophagales archaeon ANME-1-THS]
MGTRYKVVLLDMDGTFLDSRGAGEIPNEWAYEAFKKTLQHYGLTLTIDEINKLFLAPLHARGEEGVLNFCHRFGLDCEKFWSRREKDVIEAKITAIRTGVIKLCKGSEEVIRYLSTRFYLAVVSDSQQACVNYALEHFNLQPYFAIWYGRRSELKSLGNRKPNPFYINKVLRELNAHKEEAILVDDSPVGVLAAHRAGIDSVLICSNDEKLLKCEQKPTFLIRNLNELKSVL